MSIKFSVRLYILIFCITIIGLPGLSCQDDSLPPTVTAPVIPKISPLSPEPIIEKTVVAVEEFDEGIDGWQGIADDGAISEVSWFLDDKLSWSTDSEPGQITGLIGYWPELSNADGLTINMDSIDRDAILMLGVQEADESVYGLVVFLEKGHHAEYTVLFDGFGLHPETEDENGKLDIDQLVTLALVDISSIIMAPKPNQILLDDITLWKGRPGVDYFAGNDSETSSQFEEFRIGVDANFVPQAEKANHGFWVDRQHVDPLELFAVNGADSFRLRLWVGEEGESKLDYATELAGRAQEAGLKPYLVLFLAEDWADVNKQPAPVEWAELTIEKRAEAIRQYAYETTRHFIDQGISLDFYEIGNEIDYGICGVFADTTHPRDISSLRDDIWPDEAQLIKAAIDGIREADPGAHILLHIASGWNPAFASAFFQSMIDFGVDYDYIGLSYYPTAFGMVATSQVRTTMNTLSDEIGKPIIICETAYPAELPAGGMFEAWRYAIPGYPLTPEGQARWLSDMLEGMRGRGDVIGVYMFSPEFWYSGELWGPFALFDNEGNARPGIGSFGTGN